MFYVQLSYGAAALKRQLHISSLNLSPWCVKRCFSILLTFSSSHKMIISQALDLAMLLREVSSSQARVLLVEVSSIVDP